jgi:hypothetical protein
MLLIISYQNSLNVLSYPTLLTAFTLTDHIQIAVRLIDVIKLAAVIKVERDDFVFCGEKFFLKNPIFADSLASCGYHQIHSS